MAGGEVEQEGHREGAEEVEEEGVGSPGGRPCRFRAELVGDGAGE